MDWRLSVAWGVAAAGCIGQPPLVDCEDDPEHELCASGTTATGPTTTASSSTATLDSSTTVDITDTDTDTDPSTTTGGPLPDAGVCRRELRALTQTPDGPLTILGNEQWEIVFDAGENQMATQLRATALNNANLLHTGGSPTERVVSVQLSPTYFSYMEGNGDSPVLYAIASGDAVQRVSVDWDAAVDEQGFYSANGADSQQLFTPDGRVIRSEFPFVTGAVGANLWFSVVLGLDATRFTHVEWFGTADDGEYQLGSPPVTIYPPDRGEANDEPVGFCAYNEDNGLAVTFGGDTRRSGSDVCGVHPPIPPDARPWGFRAAHNADTGGETIALMFDWGRDWAPASTVYHSQTMAMVTVFPGDDPCACARAQLEAYMNPPLMNASPGMLTTQIPVTQEGEGDNDGYFEQGGYYAVIPTADTFTVTVDERAIPSVLLRITDIGPVGSTDGVTARLDGSDLTPGVDFLAQPDEDTNDGYWFWLGRELPPDTPLEISY